MKLPPIWNKADIADPKPSTVVEGARTGGLGDSAAVDAGRARQPQRRWRALESLGDSDRAQAGDFDALTELFLGEVGRPRSCHPAEGPRDPAPGAASGPRLRLTTDADDAELVLPSLTSGSTALSPGDAMDQEPEARPAETPFVECLVLGNLPVIGGAWASQYTREVSLAARRAVAAVRVQSGYVSVELIGDDAPVREAPAASDLESALRAAAARTNRWVVRVDPCDEVAAASRPVVKLVTLLTGADEMARVGAYGSLKQLASALPAQSGQSGPVIRVAIMGSPEASAQSAATKLVETVKACLGREVQRATCSAKIRASKPPRVLFSGRAELSAPMVLDTLARAIGAPTTHAGLAHQIELNTRATEPPAPIEAGHAADSTASVMEPTAIASSADDGAIDTIAAEAAIQPARPHVPADSRSSDAGPGLPHQVDDVRLWTASVVDHPAPVEQDEVNSTVARGQAPVTGRGLPLAVHLAELKPLAIECPYAAGVEFALDQRGALHLLTSDDSERDGAMARPAVGSTWAKAHAKLLAAAVGMVETGHEPVLHIFTDRPRERRGLLDTQVRMHLLAPVNVRGETGWCCVELN